MRTLEYDALESLDDDEFATYLGDLIQETPETTPSDLPEDIYLEGISTFSRKADELFQELKGYRLTAADETGMSIDKMIHVPDDALFALERIWIEVINGRVAVRKVRQIMGGSQAGATELPITEQDVELAHEALERLKLVNDSLE
jgi:hypothetical protein